MQEFRRFEGCFSMARFEGDFTGLVMISADLRDLIGGGFALSIMIFGLTM